MNPVVSTEKETHTEKEPQKDSVEEAECGSVDKAPETPPQKPAARKKTTRKKKPKPQPYDHVLIIIFLLVIFSFTLFGLGIGLTGYLSPERAGVPACEKMPCSQNVAGMVSQNGGGE
ncbi:MAG: hypothetical protein D3916_00150 [Candidatus Electrothrix sp. MAN1_4]|nr:hypothetical protein [Candidatus Electrothrix sp. MAN1_4]